MKVLFISRATLFKDAGGDTIQVKNTARYLIELGIQVDIRLCDEKINYSNYNLLHFFNIIRPADILRHVQKSRKPYVVSTIYVDYSEYEKTQRGGLAGFLFKSISADFIEYIKVIARFAVKGERIISPSYLLLGQRKAIKKVIREASFLLPNSNNEYKRLSEQYGIKKPYYVIPNAVDLTLFDYTLKGIKKQNLVLCVGRIEGRKNQLNLIRALNNTKFEVMIIGSAASNQAAYADACHAAAAPNIKFIDNVPQKQLLAYYAAAAVHVLPSWFETTGLSSLEAAVMGCNIVVTDKGDTKEYFGDMAYYCNPGIPESIRGAVELASSKPFNEILRQKIVTEYIWPVTAAKTLEAYKRALQ